MLDRSIDVGIGTDSVGLWRRDADGRVEAVNGLPLELPLEALLARGGAGVYAGTPRGVYGCERNACGVIAATANLEVAALLAGEGPNGAALWIGTNEAGLFRLDDPDGNTLELKGPPA